jgi:ribose transport system permease protein
MTDISKPLSPSRIVLSDEMIQVFYRLLAAFLICVALTILTDSFFSLGNILNVLRQTSLLFFIAAGLTLVVLTGGLDLSIGANVAISACVAGTVIHQTGSPVLGVFTGIGVGAVVGLLNGLMVTALRIPSFIATYGMLWVLNGVTYWYMAGETMHGFPAGFRQIGSGYFLGLPIPVYLVSCGRQHLRPTHDLGAGDLCDRCKPRRGAALWHPRRQSPAARLCRFRSNGGARLDHLPCAPEFGRGRYR